MSKETSFVKNAEELAKQKMDAINPELSSKFKFLIKFLSQFPEACSKPRSKKMQNKVGQEEHIEYLARSFHESRLPRKPTPPTTVPDEVVSIVLNISFNIQPENLERIKEEHRFSMAAENIVGDLLERLTSMISVTININYFVIFQISESSLKELNIVIYHSEDTVKYNYLHSKYRVCYFLYFI